MALDQFSFLNGIDIDYVDELHQKYLVDKRLVEPSWRNFFDGYEFSRINFEEVDVIPVNVQKEFRVINLINSYRSRGHLFTKTNPVRERRKYFPGKEITQFGLSDADLETVFNSGIELGIGPAKLKDIVQLLDTTYCESIGCEFMFIRHPERIKWFIDRFEKIKNQRIRRA